MFFLVAKGLDTKAEKRIVLKIPRFLLIIKMYIVLRGKGVL